ncbi:fumarylacetoacetate hydrolase family protein [Microbacterium paludicola]|uniref:Fumarylacetoacetate hydrolase family protein n=1 Tax=Microbacterium paludicola TaxID=300019 RepID=A0A4Y9FUL3_9MICO|nr:fumarylacetoacetate hydrolase family protein [Microbacterium paludicola]MBF0817090.1 fumarylacetoacetate hydrolase family protein [Microbacterium paludicola]TFU32221.1 fumarylacetoacetate hydrolase family protein [Microbacterium paludicola]
MRLITLKDGMRPAALVASPDGDRVIDLSGVAESVVRILGDASAADAARAAIEAADPSTLPLRSEVTLAPPVTPGTIFAIGYNYRGHTAADPDAVVADPAHPDVFVKTANALRGADEAVVLPLQSEDVDYEGEIALVIGTAGRDIDPADALGHVGGYTLLNDVSARDWQNRTSQWTLGKNFDGFAPLGPAVVTPDEISNPADLVVEVERDGEITVSQSTSTLIFPFAELIAYLSQAVTLMPGDVISTGTPQKLTSALATHRPLAHGDAVTIRVAGIGELTTRFVDPHKTPAP